MALSDSFQLTNSQYIPQYAGLPLEAMEKTGDALAERHYSNIAQARQLELLGLSQKANAESDADKSYIDSQVSSIQNALSEMAKSGAENATSKVAALATRFMGDEGLVNINKSIEARNREKARLEELGGKGLMNQAAYQRYLQHGSRDPESGKWNPYQSSAQQQLDYMKKQDEIVAPLTPDTYQGDLMGDMRTTLKALGVTNISEDLANVPGYLKSKAVTQLSERKVKDFIEKQGGWESYKSSEEYNQQKNILGMSDAEIKNELLSRGQAKVFEKVTKDYMRNHAFDFKAAQKAEADEANLAAAYTAIMDLPEGVIQLDPKTGKIVKGGHKLSISELLAKNTSNPNAGPEDRNPIQSLGKAIVGYFSSENSDLTPTQKKELTSFEYALDRVNSTLPEGQKMTLEQYVGQLGKDMNAPIYTYTDAKKVKNESETFFNPKSGGGSFLTTRVFTPENGNMNTTAKEMFERDFNLDFEDPESIKKFQEGVSVIGVSDPKNLVFPRAKIGTYGGKTFLIDDSMNATAAEIFTHDLYKNGRMHGSGTIRTVDPETGKPITVKYFFDPTSGQTKVEDIIE